MNVHLHTMEGKLKTRMNGSVPTTLGRPFGVVAIDDPPPRMRRTLASSGQSRPVIVRHDMGAGPSPLSQNRSCPTQDLAVGNQDTALDVNSGCDIQFIDVPKKGQTLKNTADPIGGRMFTNDLERVPRGLGPTSKLVKRNSAGKLTAIESGTSSGSRSGASNSIIGKSSFPEDNARGGSSINRKTSTNERTSGSSQSGVPKSGTRIGIRSGASGSRSGALDQRSGSNDKDRTDVPSNGRPSSGRKASAGKSSAARSGTDRSSAPRSGTERSSVPRSGTERSIAPRSGAPSSGKRRGSASSSGRSSAVSSARSGYGDVLEAEISQSSEFSEVPKPSRVIDPTEILEQNQERDFEKVYDINLHGAELTVITNLEKFTKVRVLDLSCNYIEKIENLEPNSDLRELKLYDNRLRVVERLKGCKELSSLQIQHNKIRQIGKGFSGLSKLKHLRIDCNRLLKLEASELSCCSQLTTLDISFNLLDNISALNYLPHLEELLAAGNRLRSVDLSRCKRLQEVDLSHNKLTDISGLRGLPNLQIINLGSNQLASLKGLGKSRSIQGNSCCYYLEELSELAELFIAGNPFSDPDGPHVHYMAEIQVILPNLEILDGAHVKRTAQKGAPLMRPMSASTIISVRQVEAQIKSSDTEMKNMESDILKKFDSLREMYESLPERPLSPLTTENTLDGQRKTHSRSRIQDARKFAAENF
ncbi:leucine-rich repeat protein soc-2 homolog [Argopecten irradians]|uniref:leucine-rich repeat protein soc-2 homolog n=1 Tax=Argopecten irradians TaxID=31199 RepID=UPI00371863C6